MVDREPHVLPEVGTLAGSLIEEPLVQDVLLGGVGNGDLVRWVILVNLLNVLTRVETAIT